MRGGAPNVGSKRHLHGFGHDESSRQSKIAAHCLFVHFKSGEEFVGESYGRINRAEAEQTVRLLTDYVERIGRDRLLDERIDFGVISPYKAQVQYLRRLIRREAVLKPFRELISVNTVDGFQGQERDVVIISLVRANARGEIGFLSDLRRMNVAMTRARMKLFILGDAATLSHHAFYRKLHDYALKLAQGESDNYLIHNND